MSSNRAVAALGAILLAASVLTAAPAFADDNATVEAVASAAPQDVAAVAKVNLLSTQSTAPAELVQPVSADAGDGLSVAAGEGVVNIGLPFADRAEAGRSTSPGTVTFDNENSTSTLVMVRPDSTVQVATVISSADAPTRYDYDLGLPAGASLELDGTGAVIVDETGHQIGSFAPPWAKDANGKAVATHYEVNRATLTQVVDLSGDIAFPVVADPTYTTSSIYISKAQVARIYKGMKAVGSLCAVIPLPYPLSVYCGGFAPAQAIEQAYWQGKRVRVDYISCGFNYCSYTEFHVVK